MNANPEVMPPVEMTTTRQVLAANGRDSRSEPITKAAGAPQAAPPSRLSEDPMRRTDRYRLVMPYSLRV